MLAWLVVYGWSSFLLVTRDWANNSTVQVYVDVLDTSRGSNVRESKNFTIDPATTLSSALHCISFCSAWTTIQNNTTLYSKCTILNENPEFFLHSLDASQQSPLYYTYTNFPWRYGLAAALLVCSWALCFPPLYPWRNITLTSQVNNSY